MFLERKSKNFAYAKLNQDGIHIDGRVYQGIEGYLVRFERREDEYQGNPYYRYDAIFRSKDDPDSYVVLHIREGSSAAEYIITKIATYVDMVNEGVERLTGELPFVSIVVYQSKRANGTMRPLYSVSVNGKKIHSRYLYNPKGEENYSGILPPIKLPEYQWVEVTRGRWIKANIQPRLDFLAELAKKIEVHLVSIKVSQDWR